MEMMYVKGRVPKVFFNWLDGLDGWDRSERKILGTCYLEELVAAPPSVLFEWLDRECDADEWTDLTGHHRPGER